MSDVITILHVDDDDANRYAVTRSLKKAGFNVIEAANGSGALEKAALHPDLMILDVRLPDINGFELCQKLKADPATSRIPILHLSATFTSSDDRAQGLDSGADAYLVRPVEPVELIATVGALLRTRRVEEELRQSEERYRQIIENVQDFAIFTIDLNGLVTSWNVGAERLLGYREDQIVGRSGELIYTPEDRAAKVPEAERSRALAAGCSPEERWHERWDRTRLFVSGVVNVMRDSSGRPTGFSKLMQDQTARNLAQQELRKSKEVAESARQLAEQAQLAAEQANRLKDDFLATLSHELRTPLNAIIGWSQLLRAPDSDSADLAEGLETIERNAKVQAELIEDLLDISRIISGKLRLNLEVINLVPVIEAAVISVMPAADVKGLRLRTIFDGGVLVVSGDAARLQQVAWNLLSNAIKFTPRDGQILVSVTRRGGNLELVVTDTGAGITPAFLPHVFDRFRQADATTTRTQSGLGLGLSIVKQLVELHGGSVSARSGGLGQGATFTAVLPALSAPQAPSKAAPDAPPVSDHQPQAVSRSLAGVKVLVVEDDRDSRMLLKRILVDAGATVFVASDVSAALAEFDTETVRQPPFTLIVSDIGMPGRDGYSLIAAIRSRSPEAGGKTPAIALTAFAREEDKARAIDAGFQSHVAKPADASELIRQIRVLANLPA